MKNRPEILLPSLMDFTSTGHITPHSEAAEIFGGLKNAIFLEKKTKLKQQISLATNIQKENQYFDELYESG